MIQRLENACAEFWHYPLVLLCRLTGQNNFFFARWTLRCGIALDLLGALAGKGTGKIISFGLIAIWLIMFYPETEKDFKALELAANRGDSSLPEPQSVVIRFRLVPMALFGMSFFGSLGDPLTMKRLLYLGWLAAVGAAGHFALDIQRSGKSWVRQFAEQTANGLRAALLRWLPQQPLASSPQTMI